MMTIRYVKKGYAHRLSIAGHAGYAENGSDIVCAGVSAIAYALLGFLENDDDVVYEDEPICEEGRLEIDCRGGDRANAAFDMAMIGLLQIAEQYPRCVSVDPTWG